jgi:hypothetical protein
VVVVFSSAPRGLELQARRLRGVGGAWVRVLFVCFGRGMLRGDGFIN